MHFRLSESGQSDSSIQPYSILADFYDRLMDHVDYGSWARYIDTLLRRYCQSSSPILELACGTGSFSIEMHILGYHIIGTDLSPSMIEAARSKYDIYGLNSPLFVSSMTQLPLRQVFGAVLCLYDSVNYLLKREDFISMLEETASVLESGGIFIFDVCTVKNSELFFADHTMVEQYGDLRCERICRFDRKNHIQENHFYIQSHGRLIIESHFQKIYRLDEIEAMIGLTPFVIVERFDDMSLVHGNEDSERIHYILRKK